MPLTDHEKACLKLAADFQTEVSKQLNFDPKKIYADTVLSSAGPFIGEITADKYRQCMTQQPSRTPAKSHR